MFSADAVVMLQHSCIICRDVHKPSACTLRAGTNASYVERASAVPAMNAAPQLPMPAGKRGPFRRKNRGASPPASDAATPSYGVTVINTEWGSFTSSHIPRCAVDDAIDSTSYRPGAQQFEKLVAGMYLGEIVRRCAAG